MKFHYNFQAQKPFVNEHHILMQNQYFSRGIEFTCKLICYYKHCNLVLNVIFVEIQLI